MKNFTDMYISCAHISLDGWTPMTGIPIRGAGRNTSSLVTKADPKSPGVQLLHCLGPAGYLLLPLGSPWAPVGTALPAGAELRGVGLVAAWSSLYPQQTSQLGGLILSQPGEESKERPGSKS